MRGTSKNEVPFLFFISHIEFLLSKNIIFKSFKLNALN